MVIVQITDGLGNQMFQYATGLAVSLRNGVPLRLELSHYRVHNYRSYQLNHFDISAVPVSWRQVAYMTGLGLRGVPKQLSTFLRIVLPAVNHWVYNEKHFHFDPAVLDLSDHVYLSGYWQSEKYFKEYADEIRREFAFRDVPDTKVSALLRLADDTNSVSVHIRRGDYANDPKIRQTHGACSLDYYQAALDCIMQMVENPYLFIFSDDMRWAKENFKPDVPYVFVDHNGPTLPHEDLRLMISCKYHIIANSTFSWWGAWLSSHSHKIVIAPRNWLRRTDLDTSDVVPENWLRV